MGPFWNSMRWVLGFIFVEMVLLETAWQGVEGEQYWIWIALTGQILINVLIFLNLAGLASVWLLGFFGGILSPQTATASANALTAIYARWTIGFGHAVSLTILSLVFLEPSLGVYVGMVLVLTVAAQHALTFPTTTQIFKWVSLGIISATLLALLVSAIPPIYRMAILGEPYISVKADNSGVRGQEVAAQNEEEYRKEANDRVVAVIKTKKIRTSQLPADLMSWQNWESLYLRDGLQAGDAQIYWETIKKIQKRTLPAAGRRVTAATPRIINSPQFIPWIVGILVTILVIAAIRRGRGIRVIIITLALLVIGSLLWGKTRNEFWLGTVWPAITGETILSYTTELNPKTIPVPVSDGAYRVRIEITDGANYSLRCGNDFRGYTVLGFPQPNGAIRGNSGELRINGGANGEFAYIRGGTITVALSVPNGGVGGCAVETSVHPNIILTPGT